MIYQPDHLFGVAAYGILSIITLGLGLARLKTTKAAQRTLRWRLLFFGIGLGLWAADEWRWATLWPPVPTFQHGLLYNIGSGFIAVVLLNMIWALFQSEPKADAANHQDSGQN